METKIQAYHQAATIIKDAILHSQHRAAKLVTGEKVLDDKVRKPHENPTIGILLCKSADKAFVEYVIRDYNHPMGVATYKTADDMDEQLRKALPDMEAMRKILANGDDE